MVAKIIPSRLCFLLLWGWIMKCGPDVSCVDYFPMTWGNVREGSNLLTRPWQAKDDDRKHGRDRSAAERRPRTPWSDWQGCLWPAIFSKSHITYFFHVYSYCGVKRLKFLFALEAWGTRLCNRYASLGIERQFFKIKNAWCSSISSRFSVMLSSTLVFAFKCSGSDSKCRGTLVTANEWVQV